MEKGVEAGTFAGFLTAVPAPPRTSERSRDFGIAGAGFEPATFGL
jgi:hypothetical protein